MLKEIRPAIVMIVLLTIVTGLVYPLAMTGIAQVLFPAAGQRQPDRQGRQGAGLRADRPELHRATATSTAGRRRPAPPDPNDATKTVPAPYNAANSSASNAGPTSKALIERIQGDVEKLKAENPNAPVPVDLVTTSASGLDPHITPAAAYFQVPRVAKARGLPEAAVRELVTQNIEGRFLGVLGEPRVNVLQLNMALDARKS